MTKVLIVLDADFRFAEPAATTDFTFTTLVSALTGAGMQVTKAHLGTDPTADIPNFSFQTSVNLLDFDLLWLLGRAGRNSVDGSNSGSSAPYLAADERKAIARFMAAGGGVFATGDHDSIGSVMCGNLPRVRAMRSWYGVNDTTSPMPNSFPRNFPAISAGRADTTQRNPGGDYGGDSTFAWFENQSDIVPQPITPTSSPAHPILRVNGADVIIYPDHMHEGNTQGVVAVYDYTQSLVINGESFPEFPLVAGSREMPRVIATGQTTGRASKEVIGGGFVGDSSASGPKAVNTLSAYDGRVAGVGRVVTDSTWHHYIDINLTGDSGVATPALSSKVGPNAQKGHGFNDAAPTMAIIKQVYVNIATWLARPRPSISLVLERSTFSQDEAVAQPAFAGAILVTVDGLKSSQFPGGGITSLAPGAFMTAWAPTITPVDPTGLTITATRVDSDDPTLPDRLQRFTFAYTVTLAGTAFGFGTPFKTIEVDAALTSAASATPLTDRAWLQLIKAANPFELDLANGNQTSWLSSDLRVFPVVADGQVHHGHTMPDNANRAQALQYLQDTVAGMTPAQFEGLDMTGTGSALSPFAQTTVSHKPVYNIAVARVRLNHAAAPANVRVGFRIVPAPTTAALTYHEATPGVPTGSYKQTTGSDPIPLPGTDPGATEWVSFPCFAQARQTPPENQTDPTNRKSIGPTTTETSTFCGALIDNNRDDAYLPPTPTGGSPVSLPTLMMGEHQCLVAQIMYAGAPIPDGAQPTTSDKLAQRNLVFSSIANPGLDASRMAMHTFEIEAAPDPITDAFPPDELLLDWRSGAPDGTEVRIFIPDWDADAVVEMADRFYPRHDIRKVDDHTVALPGGGVRYVPVPRTAKRHTGVIEANFPLGVRKGQRYDLAVRQITNRSRTSDEPAPKGRQISRAEAAKLLADRDHPTVGNEGRGTGDDRTLPMGAFDLGDNQVLITDLRLIDDSGDHAIVVQHPAPEAVATARRDSGYWRETIGAFQLAIPVSTKHDMLAHHLRLLSVLRWRAEWLRSDSRWYPAFVRYVELMATKVAALGGNPWSVPPTPDGAIELPGTDHDRDDGDADPIDPCPDDGFDDDGFNDGGSPDAWVGKVSGLLFDHFGDFEGFVLEGRGGASQAFFSREPAVGDLARTAWRERQVVQVITVSASGHKVRRLLIGGPPH